MFGSMMGSDDFVKKIVRIFADEFVAVLRSKGFFEHWNDFLDVETTAKAMGITREKLFEMIKEGTSPRCYRHSFGGYKFDPEDVQRWMERRLVTAMLHEKVSSSEIKEEDAAGILQIKPYYLSELRKRGEGPEFKRSSNGGAIVYTYGSLQTWIGERLSKALRSAREDRARADSQEAAGSLS